MEIQSSLATLLDYRSTRRSGDFSWTTELTKSRTGLGLNQACTLFGGSSGSSVIRGSSYVDVGYGIKTADIWRRNFLVLLGFLLFFQLTQFIAIEFFPVSRIEKISQILC